MRLPGVAHRDARVWCSLFGPARPRLPRNQNASSAMLNVPAKDKAIFSFCYGV